MYVKIFKYNTLQDLSLKYHELSMQSYEKAVYYCELRRTPCVVILYYPLEKVRYFSVAFCIFLLFQKMEWLGIHTTIARPVLYTPACFMTQSEDFIMHFVLPIKKTNKII